MIGKTILHYRILEKLGEGGMGVVYKAEDTKLGRFVALKFLPKGLEADEAERTRFIQEAKAASALNHPNVCIIYDLQEHEDKQFIVMEYVDGVTLREKIRAGVESVGANGRSPLPLKDVLSYAIQIGEALQAAHKKGIIHRDVKSDNVMINAEKQVKVMDFGLAKLKGALRLTKSTSTVGTLAYMAPEQLQGKETDARMDIFSFGVVLYEMLTGHMPFRGEYESALMYSIINTEPEPVSKYRPELSSEFQHVLNRALEKDPDDRYLSVTDMLVELRRLKRDTSKVTKRPSVEILPPETKMPAAQVPVAIPVEQPKKLVGANGRSPLRYVVPALVIIILMIASYFLFRQSEPTIPRFVNIKQITTDKGWEGCPTWSPDGGRIAYESWQGGKFDICIIQSGGGRSLNLTADQPGSNFGPNWSPDGNWIAFVSDRDSSAIGMGYYVMPALGGPARKVANAPQSLTWVLADPPCWSADGTELACLVIDSTGPCAEIVPIKGGTSRRVKLALPQRSPSKTLNLSSFVKDLSWSPDKCYFAYTDGSGMVDPAQLWVMRAADGKAFPVTDRQFKVWNPSWSRDGRFLYFISSREGSMDLWRVHIGKDGIPLGEPRLVTTDLGLCDAAFCPDGKRMVYAKGGYKMNIWKVPIPKDRSAPVKWTEAQQLTNEQVPIYFLEVSPNGKRLAFDSERDGIRHVWVMPVEGGQMWRVTTDSTMELNPRWSPDNREIVFVSYRSGYKDIWVASCDGGIIRQLTMDSVSDDFPVWSPDGKEIAFSSRRSGNLDIWIIPAQGGEARQITHSPGDKYVSDWSPDGQWLLFFSPFVTDPRLYMVRVAGGEPELVTKMISRSAIWTPDGKKIYFVNIMNTRGVATNVWEVPAEGGAERMLTDLEGRLGLIDFGLTTDGKSVFFPPLELSSDLWVMDVVGE